MINLSAFHDYDIRGIYPTEINEEFFYHLGKSVALYFKKGPIGVGYDARLSSPVLFKSLVEGLTDYAVDVVSLGQISTEMHNFACGKYGFIANVNITASHNPGQYNGAKIAKGGAIPLHSGFGLPEIKEFMNKMTEKSGNKGAISKKNIFEDWITHALTFINKDSLKNLKVVVDGGNGMGGPAWMRMKEILPVSIVPLYLDPGGRFPNHHPDPLKPENTHELQQKVVSEKADLGIALDGDADRVFFIDEEGERVSGTVTLAILAEHFLKKEKGPILYGAICGKIVPETVEKFGGKPIRTKVGHSFIKQQMREVSGILAGEHSGHFYFRDNYNAESTLIAGLIMLEILSEKNQKMSELRTKYDIYPQSLELNFQVFDRDKVIDQIKSEYKDADSIDELDGLTFWYKTFWFNIRTSKTEPLLRLNIEADNSDILKSKVNELTGKLLSLGAKVKS